MSSQTYKIGFSNLSDASRFPLTVKQSLEAAFAQHPNIQLIMRDNALDDERAVANAREFAQEKVDLAIIYHMHQRLGHKIKGILTGIPVITIDIPIELTTYFGVSNEQSGELAGQVLVEWIKTYWNNQIDKVLVLMEHRVLGVLRRRVNRTVEELIAHVDFDPDDVLYLDRGDSRQITASRALPVLQSWQSAERIAIIGFNEDSTMGALDAAQQAGCEQNVVAVGHGADKLLKTELKRSGSRLIAATDYHADEYGPQLVDLSLRMLQKERLPQENFVDISLLVADALKRGDVG